MPLANAQKMLMLRRNKKQGNKDKFDDKVGSLGTIMHGHMVLG